VAVEADRALGEVHAAEDHGAADKGAVDVVAVADSEIHAEFKSQIPGGLIPKAKS
jgi:hypothetical protein